MNAKDKNKLVELLHKYMDELVEQNEENIAESKRFRGKPWEGTYNQGIKAKYEHARILASKLSIDVNKEIKCTWEL